MYKENLALNSLHCLICHKNKPNQTNQDNDPKHSFKLYHIPLESNKETKF